MSNYCSLGTKLRSLLDRLDKDVESSYKELGLTNYKPKYTPIFRALIIGESMTIGEITKTTGLTQPGVSQLVREMNKKGLVLTGSGQDGREKFVSLTKEATDMIPTLEIQWIATKSASQSLYEEIETALDEVAESAILALDKRSFKERIVESLK